MRKVRIVWHVNGLQEEQERLPKVNWKGEDSSTSWEKEVKDREGEGGQKTREELLG